jgi:Rho GTPase-activating protein 1
MRSALATVTQRRGNRSRSTSLSSVPPARTSSDFDHELATLAASIIYKSPLPSQAGLPTYIVNAAAFPDAYEVDYNALLPYVLARLPDEDELISGTEYEIIFFAGGQAEGATTEKKQGPGVGWYLQAYQVLSRATRKKLQKLYIVHPRTWVRVLVNVFGTVVSPKFRRKIINVNTLTGLAMLIPIERLMIPPVVYLHDRKLSPDIDVPYASGRRAFGAVKPLPENPNTGRTRLPRVLRETTSFILHPFNIKTEGLFRIPPHSILSGALREAYDRGQMYIIWKEAGATFVEPGLDPKLVSEVRVEDAYGIHSAASLVKTWYRELRQPIFPESSYAALREQFGSPDVEITLEDLENILSINSRQSPLSTTSREILLRHLLPLLSLVAEREAENKMDSNNLAICFAMTLVCGSNQLEDAKMTSVIRRILQVAIDSWPQLRQRLSIGANDIWKDLQPPQEARDYEDPLEEPRFPRNSDEHANGNEDHFVHLLDADSPTGDYDDLPLERVERLPTLPPRPNSSRTVSAVSKGPTNDDLLAMPRRKPAPEPPRYSSIYGDNEKQATNSPDGYSSSDSYSKQASQNNGYSESEKKGFSAHQQTQIEVPKRKALSHQQNEGHGHQRHEGLAHGVARSASQATSAHLAHRASQRVAQEQRSSVPEPYSAPGALGENEKSQPTDEHIFRKPSWPASRGNNTQQQGIPTLAKPIIPHRPRSHEPTSFAMQSASDEFRTAVPKLRTPSAGLLRRMPSHEQTNGGLRPDKQNLKKASVDDLRRIYENRANAAEGMAQARGSRQNSQG